MENRLESLLPDLREAHDQLVEAYGKTLNKTPEEIADAKKVSKYAVLSENGDVLYCDLTTWAISMEKGYRVIRQEHLKYGGRKAFLSTVFLGLNHNYNPFGKPLWFETMIFGGTRMSDIYCERHSTMTEALEGHAEAKRWLARQEFDSNGDLMQESEADDPARRF